MGYFDTSIVRTTGFEGYGDVLCYWLLIPWGEMEAASDINSTVRGIYSLIVHTYLQKLKTTTERSRISSKLVLCHNWYSVYRYLIFKIGGDTQSSVIAYSYRCKNAKYRTGYPDL